MEERENYRTYLEMRGGGAKLQTISGDEWRRGKTTEHFWRWVEERGKLQNIT